MTTRSGKALRCENIEEKDTPVTRECRNIRGTRGNTSKCIDEFEIKKFQPPVFNIHIHVPPSKGNNTSMMLPRIQPVIHLHFDEFAKTLGEEHSSFCKKFQQVFTNPVKFNGIKFHCNSDSSKDEEVNVDNVLSSTLKQAKQFSSIESKKKNSQGNERNGSSVDDGLNSLCGQDKGLCADEPQLRLTRNAAKNLNRSFALSPENKDLGTDINRTSTVGKSLVSDKEDKTNSKAVSNTCESGFKLKKAVVVLTDFMKTPATGYNKKQERTISDKHGPPERGTEISNGNVFNKSFSNDTVVKREKNFTWSTEGVKGKEDEEHGDEKLCEPKNDELIFVNQIRCAKESKHLIERQEHEENLKDSRQHKIKEGSQRMSVSEHNAGKNDSVQLHCKSEVPSCESENFCCVSDCHTDDEPGDHCNSFAAKDLLALPKKSGEIYSSVYGSDEETSLNRNVIDDLIQGCNFSQILRKLREKFSVVGDSGPKRMHNSNHSDPGVEKEYSRKCQEEIPVETSEHIQKQDRKHAKIVIKESDASTISITKTSPLSGRMEKNTNTCLKLGSASLCNLTHEHSAWESFMTELSEEDNIEETQQNNLKLDDRNISSGTKDLENQRLCTGYKKVNESESKKGLKLVQSTPPSDSQTSSKTVLKRYPNSTPSNLDDSSKNKMQRLESSPSKKMKHTNENPEKTRVSSKKSKGSPQMPVDYIPLEVSGPTRFAVAPLNKLTPSQSHDCRSFKEKMLFGNRVVRFNSNKDLQKYQAKQRAAGKYSPSGSK